jgi:sugar O-acyltransferase (sialic acid O-acetyltransferase NeuD family)
VTSSTYIFGCGGHGKVVYHALLLAGNKPNAFIDENRTGKFQGLNILKKSVLFENNSNYHLAIGNNQIRRKLYEELNILNHSSLFSVIHPKASVCLSSSINRGSFIAAGAIVGPDAMVGLSCIINHNSVVDHDCKIGDFSHVSPSSTLGGNVTIGTGCMVGAGAVVLPGITIGNNVVIGAGAVVTADVLDDQVVVGCPAKKIN